MRVRIKVGIAWNKGLEGKIYRVLNPEEWKKYITFPYPTAVYPVEHPSNTTGNVKVLKKNNVEIVEEESGLDKFEGNEIIKHPKGSFIKVNRIPKVGDQIYIVNANLPATYKEKYSEGDILTVTKLSQSVETSRMVYCEEAETQGNYDGQIDGHEYVVVEPFEKDPEIGQAYGTLKKLGESVGIPPSEIILAIRSVMEVYKKTEPQPKAADLAPKKTERDHVVEFAKQFAEDLKDKEAALHNKWQYRKDFLAFNTEYIINYEKRTVVCLLKGYETGEIKYRGKAKAAKGDCFNVHIGKAIALAKALDIKVPHEFRWPPKPIHVSNGCVISVNGSEPFVYDDEFTYDIHPSDDHIEILDDSARYLK